MTPEIFLSLLALTFAAAITPGPNNALVAASGANFGMRRTLPHIAGITLGFPVMALVVGLALGEAFQQSASLREVVRWGGAALLLWVAWRIGTAGGIGRSGAKARPFTFVESAAFQWVNAKAWVVALGITSQFIHPDSPWKSAAAVALACVVTGLAATLTWAGLGQVLRRWLADAVRLRVFNTAMAGLIVLSVLMMLGDGA